ncbi:MAG TPA: hypothetical protein ENO23_05910 [Alphaproteobacteria bacterium]|nr:hypothetical protein [Alphaproteobacteria bacterium]
MNAMTHTRDDGRRSPQAGRGSHRAVESKPRECRRATPRSPQRLPCRVRVYDAAQGDWVTKIGQAVNWSQEGLAVQVGMAVGVGSRIEVVTPRFEEAPLCLVGTVVHTRPVLAGTFEVGIETTHVAPVASE